MLGGIKVKWYELQEDLAAGSPILAIGPGCHRIGYDDTEEWKCVVQRVRAVWHRLERLPGDPALTEARQRFLERFWVAQLCERSPLSANGVASDQPPDLGATLLDKLEIANQKTEERPEDEARIILATRLLCGLISLTQLLGATIRAGATPVTDWDCFGARADDSELAGQGDGSQIAKDRKRLRAEAIALLKEAAILAEDLSKIQLGGELGQLPTMERLGLRSDDVGKDKLELLKVTAISSGLSELISKRLEVSVERVTGSVVEWLSDLFWHVVVSGAGVPPSQDELSFYLNLHELEYTNRRFSRPHPGEYRSSRSKDDEGDDAKTLREDLEVLLADYDSGQDGRERDWTGKRESFALAMASSLVESWRDEERRRLAIALVSDYDLMFERAVLELLRRGELLHVIVPTVPDEPRPGGEASYVWLFGTYANGLDGGGGELPEPTWQRFDTLPKSISPKLGPIVIRLTGCPLFKLGALKDLKLTDEFPRATTKLDSAAVFSEHDSVRAIMALTPPLDPGITSEQLFLDDLLGPKGLTWDQRCWLFFGHRFSDWLPRLQLLFTALMLASERANGEETEGVEEGAGNGRPTWDGDDQPRLIEVKHRIAVSRGFDWPEQALLDALKVGLRREDLGEISTYFAREPDRKRKAETSAFLKRVAGEVGRLRERRGVAV